MQGLKEGQILRTISNMTYSESHYTSDEDKLGEVSVCRPIPLLTLRPKLLLGLPEDPWPFRGVLKASFDSFEGPFEAFSGCMLFAFRPLARGVILA